MRKVLEDEKTSWMFTPSQALTWMQLHEWLSQHHVEQKNHPAEPCPNPWPTECVNYTLFYVWVVCISQQLIAETKLCWQLKSSCQPHILMILSCLSGTKKQRQGSAPNYSVSHHYLFSPNQKGFQLQPSYQIPPPMYLLNFTEEVSIMSSENSGNHMVLDQVSIFPTLPQVNSAFSNVYKIQSTRKTQSTHRMAEPSLWILLCFHIKYS